MYAYFIIMAKLLIAGLIGIFLGKERKRHDKPGGSRTMGIISLGGCLTAILSLEILKMPLPEGVVLNFSRLMAYAIAGIAFIGNGIIVKNDDGIEGLTTASSLFAILILSFCIGLGYFYLGILGSILMFLILESKYWIKNEN